MVIITYGVGLFRLCLKVGEMKKGVVLYLLAVCTAAIAQPPKWTDREVWRLKLQPYMTVQQVQTLLGDVMVLVLALLRLRLCFLLMMLILF